MKRIVGALAAATLTLAVAPQARAEVERCSFEGVRVLIADAGESSIVELSARVKADAPDGCMVDWSQVVLASPAGADAAPTIAVAQTFVDHRLTTVQLADGVAPVIPRAWQGPSGVVSVRWLVEGTINGLRVEVPRTAFPKPQHPGARVERRVKAARTGDAKFGALGDLAIVASPPGAAGGVGPTGPADAERIVAELVPTGPVLELIPPSLVTLDAFRDTLPRRVLDLSPANEDGWTEVGKRAYAAALHGDPVVASLGAHTLAWLAGGLSIQAVRISKTAGGPDTFMVPASVFDAIGDVEGRLSKRYGATGRLLPLGRPAIFRKALAARPWDDAAHVAAAKAAVARLATVQPQDLAPFLVPAILDGSAAPIDPPQPVPAAEVAPIVPVETTPHMPRVPEPVIARAPKKAHKTPKRPLRRRAGVLFGALAAVAVAAWFYRETSA